VVNKWAIKGDYMVEKRLHKVTIELFGAILYLFVSEYMLLLLKELKQWATFFYVFCDTLS
jgi:hypothetical protein